jgi:hypothetical protein
MTYFTRKDPLADVASNTLGNIRNQTLVDALIESTYNTNHRSALDDRALFYVEKPENLQVINHFMKRFLMGTHLDPRDSINRLFLQLHTIGLNVEGFKGESGTYDVFQWGRQPSDHPITGSEYIDDEIFLRARMHGKIKINISAVPGGLYMIDAEIYLTKATHKK